MKLKTVLWRGPISLLMISLVLAACVPIEPTSIPTSPIEAIVTDEPNHPTPVPTEAVDYRVFENTPFFDYMPFELTYDAMLWEEASELEGLVSQTVGNCLLRPLLGRGAGPSEGPFELNLQDKSFEYLIERPQSGDRTSFTQITYFIYYQPDEAEFQAADTTWSFEMITNAESEAACFEAIQPVLETLVPKLGYQSLHWNENLQQQYCPLQTKGRLFTIAEREGSLILSSGENLGELYLVDPLSLERELILESSFEGGVIQPPLQVDGDNLVYLDSQNYMLTQAWNLTAYNFETGESKILISSKDYPNVPGLFVHFDVEAGPVYVSLVESSLNGEADRSSILSIDLNTGQVDEIYSGTSDQVRIGRLSVSAEYLLAEQVITAKNGGNDPSLLLIKFEPGNLVQDFHHPGSNPMLSDNLAVWTGEPANVLPKAVVVYSFTDGVMTLFPLYGESPRVLFLDGKHLTWQSYGGPEAPTNNIFAADILTNQTWNVQSVDETVGLVLPITINGVLVFGVVTNYMSPAETTFICSVPLEEFDGLKD